MIPQCYYNNLYTDILTSDDENAINSSPIVESDDLFESRQQPQPTAKPSTCQNCGGITDSIEYTQGYLKTKIGKRVRVEFLIGTSSMQDRTGTIVDVGISYIVLSQEETNTLLLCDIYSIKFVTFYNA